MRRLLLTVGLAAGLLAATDAPGFAPRGGQRGGGGRPAGGGGRPSPSFNRPQAQRPQMQRPNMNRPSMIPQNRPQMQRPQMPQMNRPNMGRPGGLPQNPALNRPGMGRPGTLPQNPALNRPGNRLPQNPALNRPGGTLPQNPALNRPGMIPGTRPNLPNVGGGINRPGTLPANPGLNRPNIPNPGPRPGTLPGTRPNLPGGINPLPNIGGGGINRPIRPGPGGGTQWPGGTRPGPGGGGVQWPGGNRPGWNGGGTQWPGTNRPPVIGGGTGWRPNVGPGNYVPYGQISSQPYWNQGYGYRPGYGWNNNWNRPIIGGGNFNNNTFITNNRYTNYSNVNNYRRPYGYGYGYGYGSYYRPPYAYYNNWYNGGWSSWNTVPAFWAGAAATGYVAANSFAYANPYYSTTVAVPNYVNYSVPIPVPEYQPYEVPVPVPTPSAASPTFTDPAAADATVNSAPIPPPAKVDPKAEAAAKLMTVAREQFKLNDFRGAQKTAEDAIAQNPGDPALHEFRALTLFAQGKYKDAAAGLYAVLAQGPGMNWDTLLGLYKDEATYTQQLNALEAEVKANPNSAESRFVLAYQALVLGQFDTATQLYEEVVKLQPNDKLSAQLLDSLKKSKAAGDKAAAEQKP